MTPWQCNSCNLLHRNFNKLTKCLVSSLAMELCTSKLYRRPTCPSSNWKNCQQEMSSSSNHPILKSQFRNIRYLKTCFWDFLRFASIAAIRAIYTSSIPNIISVIIQRLSGGLCAHSCASGSFAFNEPSCSVSFSVLKSEFYGSRRKQNLLCTNQILAESSWSWNQLYLIFRESGGAIFRPVLFCEKFLMVEIPGNILHGELLTPGNPPLDSIRKVAARPLR